MHPLRSRANRYAIKIRWFYWLDSSNRVGEFKSFFNLCGWIILAIAIKLNYKWSRSANWINWKEIAFKYTSYEWVDVKSMLRKSPVNVLSFRLLPQNLLARIVLVPVRTASLIARWSSLPPSVGTCDTQSASRPSAGDGAAWLNSNEMAFKLKEFEFRKFSVLFLKLVS